MFRFPKLLMLRALLLLAASAETESIDFDDQNLNDYCTICSCTSDGTEVDCSKRALADIPDGMSDKVLRLNISNNEITYFPYKLQKLSNLVTLDISSNLIETLPEDALENLTNLEVLNLSNNLFIGWLSINPNDVLKPAVALKTLNLSNNKMNTLADLTSRELFISPTLEVLILDNCDIVAISGRSPLGGLTAIKILNLKHNPIRRVQGLVSPTLKSLDLSHGQLTYIQHNELRYLSGLIHLQLSHNNRLVLSGTTQSLKSDSLRYLDVSYCNLMQHSIGSFPNLKKVVLKHNMIRFLDSREFVNNSKLEYIDISNNNIGSLKPDTFLGLNVLKYLDLSWNEIATIPETLLLKMPSLKKIIVARNYLTSVGHLKSLSLTELDMNSCEIISIGKDSFEGLPNLVEINLSINFIPHLPESMSSDTLRTLNVNYNRISTVSNLTFHMLPRLTTLSVIGNRFTTVWSKTYFNENPYLEKLELGDNTWTCDCSSEMYGFYQYLTLEPNKKEETTNLKCNSPRLVLDMTWHEACYFSWYGSDEKHGLDQVTWFILIMIFGMILFLIIVALIKRYMRKRLEAIQAERTRQVEDARDRLRQLRLRQEQEAQCNAPDPRDLVSPPSYDEALTMPKLSMSSQSLSEPGVGKSRRSRGKRKTKSSSDLLEETECNGDLPAFELTNSVRYENTRRRRRRNQKYGSHDIEELDHSPGTRRRRMSSYAAVADADDSDGIVIEVEADVETPLRLAVRRESNQNTVPESNF